MEDQSNAKVSTGKGPPREGAGALAEKDLSREIERAVDREPLDTVRCVRVFGNFYRCNWWCRLNVPRKGSDFAWAGILLDSIRTSRFLTANMLAGKLVIEEVSGSVSSPVAGAI